MINVRVIATYHHLDTQHHQHQHHPDIHDHHLLGIHHPVDTHDHHADDIHHVHHHVHRHVHHHHLVLHRVHHRLVPILSTALYSLPMLSPIRLGLIRRRKPCWRNLGVVVVVVVMEVNKKQRSTQNLHHKQTQKIT
jgi:hypothetical protein